MLTRLHLSVKRLAVIDRARLLFAPERFMSSLASDEAEDGKHAASSVQRPQQAHIKHSSRTHGHKKHKSIENELSEAMQSSLMPITPTPARATSSERLDNPFLYGTASSLRRPVTLALAPSRRRSSYSVSRRQRSLSINSLDLAGDDVDPFAWLRQTVQEQRRQASQSEHVVSPSISLPASPLAAAHFASSPTSMHDNSSNTKQNDYFGAGLLSLVAGKGPVREHLHENVPSHTSAASTSRFALPSMPAFPTMPAFQTPTLPSFKPPTLPSFKAPSASAFMPDSFARIIGANAGEGENRKYMDEEDQTTEDEPDWARIKVCQTPPLIFLICRLTKCLYPKDKYEKPQLPMVFLHGLFGFSVLGPSNLPAFQIQYWRGVREALEELGVEVLMTASPASGSKFDPGLALIRENH